MDQGQSYNSEIIWKPFTEQHLNKQAALMKITFLTEEWTQSTKDSCSTLMRQMAIELSRIENVEIGILIPSASPKDRKDTQKYNIKVFEPEKYPGYESVDCLQFPQGFSTDFIISHGIKPDVMDRSPWKTLQRIQTCLHQVQILLTYPESKEIVTYF